MKALSRAALRRAGTICFLLFVMAELSPASILGSVRGLRQPTRDQRASEVSLAILNARPKSEGRSQNSEVAASFEPRAASKLDAGLLEARSS